MNIISYNILCTDLAIEKEFPTIDEEFLNNENRFKKILCELLDGVSNNTILCLQEISEDWCGKLHTFFYLHD